MALVSPGIQVTVTDQSNYVPSANGSVPYILLATTENKSVPGGGDASGTLAENAGKLYAITSQRDLVNTFGAPVFQQTASGAPINGSEINEYGLLAAYSALGVSNQVYVQRADINLSELEGSTSRPSGEPANGTYWLDVDDTVLGIFAWNASTEVFSSVQPLIDITSVISTTPPDVNTGAVGDYLVKAAATPMTGWYKSPENEWVEVGTTDWQLAISAVVGTNIDPVGTSGNIVLNGNTIGITTGDTMSDVVAAINLENISGVQARLISGAVAIAVSSDATDNALVLSGAGLTEIGMTAGTYNAATVTHSSYFAQPQWMSFDDYPRPTGSLWIKTSHTGEGTNVAVKQYNSLTKVWSRVNVENYYTNGDATYANDPTTGGIGIPVGTVWCKFSTFGLQGDNETLSWNLWYRKNSGATVCTGLSIATQSTTSSEFTLEVTQPGVRGYDATRTATVTLGANTTPAAFVAAITSLAIPYLNASVNIDGKVVISHARGGDINISDVSGDILDTMGLVYNSSTSSATNFYRSQRGGVYSYVITNWSLLHLLGYLVASDRPYSAPADGALWYWNSPTKVDIMINNGTDWVGYRNLSQDIRGYDLTSTDVNGVQVQTTAPTTKSDGSVLSNGDLWVDSSDLENFPRLHRYQTVSGVDQWVLIDNEDNISQNGIVFADARWSTAGNIDPIFGDLPTARALTTSNYLDLDAPDPALYPRGILLFNTRASSYGVKKYVENYFTEEAYPNESLPAEAATWLTVSGVQVGGTAPAFGRHAQRAVIISALKAAIDSSTAIREEQNSFSILACPGYPELIPNLIALNNDRNNTGFIIGDSPMRLAATGTDIINWAQNSSLQSQTNEHGLVNHDPYLAVYYPSGLANDLSGNAVAVPASHAMIRTMIRSDNASYPWFPAAGTRRGLLDNVSSVGYVDPISGTFVSIGVTQGLRDTLYANQINPLTYLQGAGLVCYGNKTTVATPSALDRINVARLINYIRQQLDRLARPYIFEPNDPLTRSQIKSVTESLLNDIVSKRGVSDYLVVCDTTNNTPDRIARNELYVDVAIQPTKDVEFIYIPIRLKNPGELESGNVSSSLTVGTGA